MNPQNVFNNTANHSGMCLNLKDKKEKHNVAF